VYALLESWQQPDTWRLRSTPKLARVALISIAAVLMLTPFAAGALARVAVNPGCVMTGWPARVVPLAGGAAETRG